MAGKALRYRSARRDWRRLENQIDATVPAPRTHPPLPQAGERHVSPSSPGKRFEAQLGLIVALGTRARVIDDASKTSRMNAPARCNGLAKGLDLHENRMRTPGGPVKLCGQRWRGRRSTYGRARARGPDTTVAAAGVARTGSSLATPPAFGGAEVDKLASARSPSAAAAPATRTALVGRTERNVNTVLIHQTSNLPSRYAQAQITAVTARTARHRRTDTRLSTSALSSNATPRRSSAPMTRWSRANRSTGLSPRTIVSPPTHGRPSGRAF